MIEGNLHLQAVVHWLHKETEESGDVIVQVSKHHTVENIILDALEKVGRDDVLSVRISDIRRVS